MIDIKKIYDRVVEDMHSWKREYTHAADGNSMRRECYTYNDSIWAKAAVEGKTPEPIDLGHRLKHVRAEKFVPPPESESIFDCAPMRGNYRPFPLGDGVQVPVDYSQNVYLYQGGLASIRLQMTDEYYEAAVNFKEVFDDLPDFEDEKKEAKARGEQAYRDEHPFDPDEVFVVGKAQKDARVKNRDEAIRKKKSQWEQAVSRAGKRAAEDAVGRRNGRITASGLSDETVRLVLNGSLDLETGTLWWYPTTLDLVRMFKLTIKFPTKFFLQVDLNDDNPPPEDPAFSRALLAEGWNSAKRGEQVFDDIRDGLHTDPNNLGRKGPFPVIKKTRWNQMVKRLKPAKRPLKPGDRPQTFMDDDRTTWEGRTGMPMMRLQTRSGVGKYSVITVDGIRVVYKDPSDDAVPITAFFMTPHALAVTLRDAINPPEKISPNLIRRTFLNMEALQAEAGDMFAQKAGTRRYLP